MFSATTKDDINNLKNASQNTIYDGKDDLTIAANNAGRKVRNMIDSASDEFSQASDKVTSEIRSNPVRSAAVALGVGVLLGLLIRR